MIAPVENQQSRPSRLLNPEDPREIQLQGPPRTSNHDDDLFGVLRRRYHQYVRLHPVGATSVAIAFGIAVGLMMKRNRKK